MSSVIKRERLLQKLEAASEHKLTLVCAPPGFGKTTLAWQFLQESELESIWYSIEERDRDFATFFNQFANLMRQKLPLLESVFGSVRPEPIESAAALANGLRLVLKQDIFLVIDDIHYMIGDPRFETWLTTLISLLPSKCHLVLLSRVLPVLPIAEMVARREILAIGQQELRFTDDEITQLAATTLPDGDYQPPAQELIRRLEGWPAGLVLAFQPLPFEVTELLLSGSNGPEALFNSLAEFMLNAQPPHLREFLLASSLLSRLNPEVVANVLGLRNASQLIDEALRKNLFLSRNAGRLAFHGLFRSFLQQRFYDTSPDRYFELHIKAAEWFAQHNQMEDAFEHFMAANQPRRAAEAAATVIQSYFEQGRVETLLQWNESLISAGTPDERFLYVTATIYIDRFDFDAASRQLDQVEALAAESGNVTRLSEVLLQRTRIYVLSGHYLAAIAQAEKLLATEYNDENARGRTLRTLGIAYYRLGKTDEALNVLESALVLSRQYGDKHALSNLLQDLQLVYMRVGKFDQASACLQEVVAIRRSVGSPTLLTHALNDLGYHYHQQGDYPQAFAAFQEGLSIIVPLENRRIESYLLWSLGDLHRDLGSFDEALQLYNRALAFAGNREPSLRANLLLSISTLYRWQKRFDDAIMFAEEALLITKAHGLAMEHTVAQVSFYGAHAYHEPTRALLEQLETLAQQLIEQQANAEAGQAMAICAHTSLLLLNTRYADTQITAAVNLLGSKGNVQPLVAEIIHTPELDRHVLTNLTKLRGLTERLSRLRESQLRKSVIIRLDEKTSSEYVYSLRIQTLGKEKIERDGVPVLPGEWRATAARELFFYLLFMGPQRRETISLGFWPDSPAERVRSNFHTTLYRLRQALGENVVVYNNELYSINPDVDIWCDAREFDKLVQHALNLSIRDARTEDLFRRAVDLYQGDFLPLLDAEWITTHREHLRETYLDSVIGLGYCADARMDYRQALNFFKQALKLDYFREDVHRAIMSSYANLGERQKIFAHLKHMQDIFRQELAMEPTKEIVAWAKRLLS